MARPKAHQLSRDELDALRGLVLARSTRTRVRISLAVEEFVDHPACTQLTREWIVDRLAHYRRTGIRPQWPLSLRRAVSPTAALSARLRGDKALSMEAPSVRRGGFWVDAKGQTRSLQAYDIYESDDVSINEPFRWKDPETGLWMAGRQTLATIDVGSAGFLGCNLIGRPKDAYRQEDIADHFLDVCDQYGMPQAWRLERGSWAATFVEGIRVDGMEKRWGALDELFRVLHTDGPRGKGLIEERFDILQTMMAHTEGGITLGRHAGEFERAARMMRRVSYDLRREIEGKAISGEAVNRLWKIEVAADAVRAAMERANGRIVERGWDKLRMVPAEALQAAGKGRAIPPQERWRFHPCKTTATVRGGMIEVRHNAWPNPFRFACNGVVNGLYLEDGFKALIAYHPSRPELGAAIASRDTGVKNRGDWALGQIIHHALPYQPYMPQVDLTTPSGAAGTGVKARFSSATRQEFRGVAAQMKAYNEAREERICAKQASPAAAKARRSEARDGQGNRAEHAGTTAPVPDLSALRQQAFPAETAEADSLSAFRHTSLFTDEEREEIRYG